MGDFHVQLPDDVWFMVCDQLVSVHDFGTLYSVARTSRRLTFPALAHLYRECHFASCIGGGSDSVEPDEQSTIVEKWSILWRSIVASSLNKTLYPYCRYIRVLDLHDLEALLDDDWFKLEQSKEFFTDTRPDFNISLPPRESKRSQRTYTKPKLNVMLETIGEVLTKHTPMVELVEGIASRDALLRWAPRLPRLKKLKVFDGAILEGAEIQAAVIENCPRFEALELYNWVPDITREQDRDRTLAGLLNGMVPQAFRSLVVRHDCGLASNTFLALGSNHGTSLKELIISLGTDALPHLGLLQECKALETLKLEGDKMIDLKETYKETFDKVESWLPSCNQLCELEFTGFPSGAALASAVLLNHGIKLKKLSVDEYVANDHRALHEGLENQGDCLETLLLKEVRGDHDVMSSNNVKALVKGLSQLTNLRKLILHGVADDIDEQDLRTVIEKMQYLEHLDIGCTALGDGVLPGLAKMESLKNVIFPGYSTFSTKGLLAFVSNLGPGNASIHFTVLNPDRSQPCDAVRVHEAFQAKANGYFHYQEPESETDDSD